VSGDGGGVAVTEMMIRGKTLRYRIFGVGVGDGWGDVIRGGCKKEWKGNTKRKLCKHPFIVFSGSIILTVFDSSCSSLLISSKKSNLDSETFSLLRSSEKFRKCGGW